jgi:hypothetical protein
VQLVGHVSDPRFLVIHGLRLKGFVEAEPLAELVGLPPSDVAAELAALTDAGLVLHRDGRLSGWSLTPVGREEHARLVADEVETAGARDDIDVGYRAFLSLNPELLAVCTAWQLRDESTLNDHSDAAYDACVIERLSCLHVELDPALVPLEGSLDRFTPYRPRFDGALARVQAGEADYFARPMIDSYHTVWFELHEDLLTTLGLERSKEGA